ncbi:MAG: Bpu10I family restriction endonuclease [Chloroflexota bacterium]
MAITYPTPHLKKLNAALNNNKLPHIEKPFLENALIAYENWIEGMRGVPAVDETSEMTVEYVANQLVQLLNTYKLYIDLNIICDSPGDFLYRQKGQLKLDNTIIEEFLPYLIFKTIPFIKDDYEVGPKPCYAAMYFDSSLGRLQSGGGPQLRRKEQDFVISRQLFIKASHHPDFTDSVERSTYLDYIVAECKTNLDKTMFQEATATAHDTKSAVPGANYYLLCEWLDMTPVSTASTDIDEVLILRKAKRIPSNIRRHFSTVQGRADARNEFERFLTENPFEPDVFLRFVNHILSVLENEDPIEEDVLNTGYF